MTRLSDRDMAKLTANDAEMSVLGGCAMHPDALSWLDLEASHFANPRNRVVWEAMVTLAGKGVAIDVVTLERELTRVGKLEAVGGLSYLGEVFVKCPTADHIEHYAGILREAAITRRVALLGGEVNELIHQGITGEDLLSEISARVSACESAKQSEIVSIADAVKAEIRAIDAFYASGQTTAGIPTGIQIIDEKIGGLPLALPAVLAARPKVGKSAAGLNFGFSAAGAGFPALVCSNEDQVASMAQRAMGKRGMVPISDIRARTLTRIDLLSVNQSVTGLEGLPLHVVPVHRMTARQIVRLVRGARRKLGIRLLILDYVQLIPPEPGDKRKRTEQIADAMRELAALAYETKDAAEPLSVLILSQIGRSEEGSRPTMQSFAESGSIEQSGKLLMALHPKKDIKGNEIEDEIEVLVLGNSQGPTGKFTANFHRPTCRIW